MTLACPHCGYSREVDTERLPARATRVNCPRCRQAFPLPTADEAEPAETAPATATPGGAETAGTVAAEPQPKAVPDPIAGAEFGHAYAGFWIRVVASMVDSLLVTAVQLFLGLFLGLTAAGIGGELAPRGEAALAATTWLFGTALAAGYYVFFTGYCGQTPGKMALRIKVIRSDGSELGYGRAALREIVGKFVSGIILGIGYLMVAFDERKQGLHDRMAGTYVIKL